MRASEVKVGNVYYVDFNPFRKGEFDGTHLALVLKKTVNEITFIVIPMTSDSTGATGEKRNKIILDISNYLPPHLRNKTSYAVYDQIRTVNASRLRKLYENEVEYDAKVPDSVIDQAIEEIFRNLLFGLDDARKEGILAALKVDSDKQK